MDAWVDCYRVVKPHVGFREHQRVSLRGFLRRTRMFIADVYCFYTSDVVNRESLKRLCV